MAMVKALAGEPYAGSMHVAAWIVVLALSPFCADAATETVDELCLDSDTTVTVAAGNVKHIEYLSGTAFAKLTKEGDGTLEIAIVGNTNATLLVNGGGLKFVRPGKMALDADDAAFHVDGSDADSYVIQSTDNGTNFVQKILDVDGRDNCATNMRANFFPYIATNALNGLSVFDFGSIHIGSISGKGAPMGFSSPIPPNEVFYVWADEDGAREKVAAGSYGPVPVCLLSAGYRGTNTTAGSGWKLFRTSTRITANLYLDDVRAENETVPGDGWHLLRTYSTSAFTFNERESYSAALFGARRTALSKGLNTPYGGFRLAEAVICSNYLSVAKRAYVNFYLQRKWFGGYPVRRILLSSGTTLDAADGPMRVTYLQADEGASFSGFENVSVTPSASGAADCVHVSSGTYSARDRSVAAIPNLGFSTDGEVALASGTNALNRVDGNGTFTKSGAGLLYAGHLEPGISSLAVTGGALVVDPLRTSSAVLHVAADDQDAFALREENGTNFVTRWEDVSRNGQALTASNKKYVYNSSVKVNAPFLAAGAQNGLAAVSFGTQSDSEHQGGWGAILDVAQRVQSSADTTTAEGCAARQVFIVWQDDPSCYDAPYVEDLEGLLKPFVGPSIYGSGGTRWRGPGGNGSGYPYMRAAPGSNAYREGLRLDDTAITVTAVGTTILDRGFHLADHQIGAGSVTTSIEILGGDETCNSTNGPYASRGVYGGVTIGEFMAFRYHLPSLQRKRIAAALGVKWFGSEKYSLEYAFDSVALSDGASLAFPYADVTVTNMTLTGGEISARSFAVHALDIAADSAMDAPLSLAERGTLVLHGNAADGLATVNVASCAFGESGTIDISNLETPSLCGRSYRIMETDSVSGSPAHWRGHCKDPAVRATLEVRADGVYATFRFNGIRLILR